MTAPSPEVIEREQMIDQPFYDLPDVSRKLGNCSRSTLYRLIEQGKLVRVRLGGKALITGRSLASCVDALMATESAEKRAEERGTVEYQCWKALKQRCLNSNNRDFKDYGGRGIKVCERWSDSYENFLADMGRKPSPQHSIDRYPDNDGNYEPSNCRWATPTQQSANRRPHRRANIATPDTAPERSRHSQKQSDTC